MPNNPQQNHLLAALPAAAYRRLLPHLVPVDWQPGSVLCESGSRQGGGAPSTRAVVQCAGNGYRINAGVLKTEFDRDGGLQILMLRFAQMLIAQMAQTALCNATHTAEQQLCRWLLLSLDGLPSNERTTTQELLAEMPDMRNGEVTQAVLSLWAAGSIQYRRGKIVVLDRPKLERRACECYGLMKRESGRLLPRLRTALEALA